MKLTLKKAQKVVKAAMKKAEELGCKMNISVIDESGVLRAFARMDGAWLGSADISMKKAKTAFLFNMPTGVIGKLSQPREELWQIEGSNNGLITFPGGRPLIISKGEKNITIGAIGVSGSSVVNDDHVSVAGASALSVVKIIKKK